MTLRLHLSSSRQWKMLNHNSMAVELDIAAQDHGSNICILLISKSDKRDSSEINRDTDTDRENKQRKMRKL
jgi:superfamily II DNA helicase RecQ